MGHPLDQFADEGVGEAAARSDGVEGFAQFGNAMGLDQFTALDFIAHDHRRNQCETFAFAGEETEHGHVIELGEDAGTDACGCEDLIEAGAGVAFEAGEDDGDVLKVGWEPEFGALFPCDGTDEADGFFGEKVAMPGGGVVAAGVLVGEDEVDLMGLKEEEEIAQVARAANDLDVGSVQGGAEELELEVAGEGGDSAETEDLSTAARAVLHDIHEFLTGATDGFGIVEGDLAGLGEDEAAAGALEEFVAEVLFELTELDAECWGREVQFFGGASEAEFAGDDAEIAQVMIIEEAHAGLNKSYPNG